MTNQLTTLRQSIQIPFDGFYESWSGDMIEDAVNQAFDYEGTGDPEVPDDFYMKWDCKAVQNAFCKSYVEYFQAWLKDTFDLDVSLEFQEMTSPRFYNFETDKIYCWISHLDVCKIYNLVNTPALREMVRERHTSYDGFISFYSNDLDDKDDVWGKDLHEWDEIQLMTLLMALIEQEGEEVNTYDIMQDASCSGEMDNIVFGHCGKECLDMANAYYQAHQSQQDQKA